MAAKNYLSYEVNGMFYTIEEMIKNPFDPGVKVTVYYVGENKTFFNAEFTYKKMFNK